MSKKILAQSTRVVLNGEDITSEVLRISVETEPGNLTVAQVTFYVHDIEKDNEGNIVYHLGREQ